MVVLPCSFARAKFTNISEPCKKGLRTGIRNIQRAIDTLLRDQQWILFLSTGDMDSPVEGQASLASAAWTDTVSPELAFAEEKVPTGCALYPKARLQPRGGQPSPTFGLLWSTASSGCPRDEGSWNVWRLTKLTSLPASLGMAQVLRSAGCVGLGVWL